MKRLLPLILVLFILTSCSQQQPAVFHPATKEPIAAVPTKWKVSLDGSGYKEILPLGSCLLLIQQSDNTTVLSLFNPKTLQIESHYTIPDLVSLGENNLRVFDHRIGYYSTKEACVVILSQELSESQRIYPKLSNGIAPLLCYDLSGIFYLAGDGLHCVSFETGIDHLITDHPISKITGQICNDSYLICSSTNTSLSVLSTQDGSPFPTLTGAEKLLSSGDMYYAEFRVGADTVRILGKGNEHPKLLMTECDSIYLIPELDAALIVNRNPGNTSFSIYNVESGKPLGKHEMKTSEDVNGFCWLTESEQICFYATTKFGKITLWGLDMLQLVSQTEEFVLTDYYTSDHPDEIGLLACAEQAKELGQDYEIDLALSPSYFPDNGDNFLAIPEYQVSDYENAISTLTELLGNLPDCLLEKISDMTSDKTLHIGLYASVYSSQNQSNHHVYWNNGNCYVLLSCLDDLTDQFYHSLGKIMDTAILVAGKDFENWEQWNPENFAYSQDYTDFLNTGELSEPEKSAFVSSLAMVSPVEDRAEVFRAAMEQGNEDLFSSTALQDKLYQICKGLRRCMKLNDSDSIYPWEQYLITPLNIH